MSHALRSSLPSRLALVLGSLLLVLACGPDDDAPPPARKVAPKQGEAGGQSGSGTGGANAAGKGSTGQGATGQGASGQGASGQGATGQGQGPALSGWPEGAAAGLMEVGCSGSDDGCSSLSACIAKRCGDPVRACFGQDIDKGIPGGPCKALAACQLACQCDVLCTQDCTLDISPECDACTSDTIGACSAVECAAETTSCEDVGSGGGGQGGQGGASSGSGGSGGKAGPGTGGGAAGTTGGPVTTLCDDLFTCCGYVDDTAYDACIAVREAGDEVACGQVLKGYQDGGDCF